eukprot:scaffold129008_cov105-Phaeocystis_antarctica.AAC.1
MQLVRGNDRACGAAVGDPVLCAADRCVDQMGGVQSAPRGGFRALKKTTEAPCTTKVNYR